MNIDRDNFRLIGFASIVFVIVIVIAGISIYEENEQRKVNQARKEELAAKYRLEEVKTIELDCDTGDIEEIYNINILKCYGKLIMNEDGTVQAMYGKYSDLTVDSFRKAVLSLYRIKSYLGMEEPKDELEFIEISCTSSIHRRFRQIYHGIRVYERIIDVITDYDGNIEGIESGYQKDIDVVLEPTITSDEAIEIVLDAGYEEAYLEGLFILVEEKSKLIWSIKAIDVDKSNQFVTVLVNAETGEICSVEMNLGFDSYEGCNM